MKFTYIKEDVEVEVIAKAPFKNYLINQIESLCIQDEYNLVGYQANRFKELNPLDIEYFSSYGDKVYANINSEEYTVKYRLYELKELLQDNFIYINQSVLANINMIDHFEATIGGALMVVFKSGYKDYISRRQVKNVKERILKKNG